MGEFYKVDIIFLFIGAGWLLFKSKDNKIKLLFYKIEGTIANPKEMVVTLVDVFLMDKGTGGYTEYLFDGTIVMHMMKNPELNRCLRGHIHSHNDMSVFFSDTDWSELNDNCPNFNFYLSLIVNNYMEMMCRKILKRYLHRIEPYLLTRLGPMHWR